MHFFLGALRVKEHVKVHLSKIVGHKIVIFYSYLHLSQSVKTCVVVAQKSYHIDTVLLRTACIC